MLRAAIFGLAVLVVFTGIATFIPILEAPSTFQQVAAVAATPRALPTCTIAPSKDVIEIGEEISIAWTSENASVAWLSDVGEVSIAAGMFVTPEESTTYTLTVGSESGAASSCSTSVVVE